MNKTSSTGIADMMSALMMIFMFISIALLAELELNKRSFDDELNNELHLEFGNDLHKWDATITDDNIFRFKSPFKQGSTKIPSKFSDTLTEFCPRYINLLSNIKFQKKIEEVRVEGHTSKGWNSFTSDSEAYIKNMDLSQNRANQVLKYCYMISTKNKTWFENKFRAIGFSSSIPIKVNENYNAELSRRVDFSIKSM